ncbi:head-tail joining protein [Pseudogemmobacter humi]|uniref:Phage Head-Tail Attachment n=1 Tax=Pseudogemmobacter humi TaxID=2483812 RepID=A0A3P5XA89_9RHOB|nr:hypothetical protein [Pseudogemmobacter humi]VDC31418.1 hypothetical protein XINFAN_02882 [Pseudogemmobacter humi]
MMTGLFDGVAGLLNDVFGGSVTHRPKVGLDRIRHWIFRAPPVEVEGEDGHSVLDVAPFLKVPRPDASSVSIGDLILPGNGNTYKVVNLQPSGSPAADAFVVFDLELVP